MPSGRQQDPIDVERESGLKRAQSSDTDIVALSEPPAHLLEQTKERHRADLEKHAWQVPVAERVQDAWEVAYVWAFIVRFDLLKDIKGLVCVEDLEEGLRSWVPDEALENTLIAFLSNLRSNNSKLDSTTLQPALSRYIHDQLTTTHEFTVWDRPWAPNEEARGPCCIPEMDDDERQGLGRLRYRGEPMNERGKLNPIKGWQDGNGGLWSLSWFERAQLLRQLVDWQLTNCNEIREKIKEHYRMKNASTNMNFDPATNPLIVTPIGLDKDRNRIWSLDDSSRLYSSGNPFKRPSPLVTCTQTKEEYLQLMENYAAFRDSDTPKETALVASKRGKANRAEFLKAKKLLASKESEGKLAQALEARLPSIEKHDQKVARAQKKVHAAVTMAALAETRTTRTRRQANKPDYVYDGMDDDEPRRGKRRYDDYDSDGSNVPSTSAKPIIPGERRSTRVAAAAKPETASSSRLPSRENSPVPPSAGPGSSTDSSNATKKAKGMKGYAWVEQAGPTGTTELPETVNDEADVNGEERVKDLAEEPVIAAAQAGRSTIPPPNSDTLASPLETQSNGEAHPMDEDEHGQ